MLQYGKTDVGKTFKIEKNLKELLLFQISIFIPFVTELHQLFLQSLYIHVHLLNY